MKQVRTFLLANNLETLVRKGRVYTRESPLGVPCQAVDSIILGARPAAPGTSCPAWDVAVRVPGLCEVIVATV